ncbi:MAG: AbrB/MazE/SpoVT family DNA-binding domain-containing protein [Actinobacteria bacterium]|nr:AbrB/MazE/SpoVT family DNA-binding domain-containing protein [Actinomycetota bacterium]
MVKRMTRHGNSMALVIDRPILELLNIDADTPLEITTDGEALIITPVRDKKRRQAFEAALEKANRRYGRMLKNLAD